MSVGVECREVTRSWNSRAVLRGVDWRLPAGAMAGLVGASGAGKTTLLRIIAGLEPCSSGSVELITHEKSAPKPKIGMVFQNLGLWPHLTALAHVNCVLPQVKQQGSNCSAEDKLNEVRLPETTWRQRPAELSGGEAQRLALARALACNPQLLLLDEPLAQLDAPLRLELLELIKGIATERRMTVIYVTHAWQEVAALCDQIAVLQDGQIAQTGSFDEVYLRPVSPAVARLTGSVIELPKSVFERGLIAFESAAPAFSGNSLLSDVNDNDSIFIRPQQLQLIAAAERNRWRVESCRPAGDVWSLQIANDAEQLRLCTSQWHSLGTLVGLRVGSPPGTVVVDTGL